MKKSLLSRISDRIKAARDPKPDCSKDDNGRSTSADELSRQLVCHPRPTSKPPPSYPGALPVPSLSLHAAPSPDYIQSTREQCMAPNVDPTFQTQQQQSVTQTRNLCHRCSAFDLTYYESGQDNVPGEFQLAPIADLVSLKYTCDLCALTSGLVVSKKGHEWLNTMSKSENPATIVLRPWEMGIEVYVNQSSHTSEPEGPNESTLLGEFNVISQDESSLAMINGGHRCVSRDRIRRLLVTCESDHGDACNKWTKHNTKNTPVTLLLIDVEEEKLVSFDIASHVRYVALSYVWGQVQMLKTTQDNLLALMQSGSFAKLKLNLPRVVLDAMEVVRMIGERYLWVDAISIVQDDPIWKHQQIVQMDSIYSSSILTIVAMGNSHANEGIPGVSLSRLPKAAKIGRVLLTRSTPSLDDALLNTVYESRAWTLQEKVLSKRCLFFSGQEVFFRCNAGIYREMEKDVSVKLGATNSIYRMNSVNPLVKLNRDTALEKWISVQGFNWDEHFGHYAFLVQDYTKRRLSFPGDVLLAFAGIQAQFTAHSGGGFICGLPELMLDYSLLWTSRHGFRRIRRTAPVSISNAVSIQAPSWSWAGWDGPVGGFLDPNSSLKSVSLVNRFHVFTPHDGSRIVNRRSDSNVAEDEHHSSSDSEILSKVLERSLFSTYFLIFTSETVDLPILRVLHHINGKQPWKSPTAWILDKSLTRTGILLDDIPADVESEPERFSFVGLGLSHWGAIPSLDLRDGKDFMNPWRQWLPKDTSMPTVHVMLIKWIDCGGESIGLAERVAIGVIWGEAWKTAYPKPRKIVLQ